MSVTALSVSPWKVSANVEARPAVGIENAIKNPRITSLSMSPLINALNANIISTIIVGKMMSLRADT